MVDRKADLQFRSVKVESLAAETVDLFATVSNGLLLNCPGPTLCADARMGIIYELNVGKSAEIGPAGPVWVRLQPEMPGFPCSFSP
jgi:hypothetical protein